MLLMGVLSQPTTSLSAAQLKIDSSSLIAKDGEIHHKWFLRYSLSRPEGVVSLNPFVTLPLVGHFRVALRDPEGELIFHRTYSFEALPDLFANPSLSPLLQTIKIHKPIKGQYQLLVTLLDRKSESGAFDPNAALTLVGSYLSSPTLFDEHNTILLKSSTSSSTPFIPSATSISKPTDPKVTGEQTFTLHLP